MNFMRQIALGYNLTKLTNMVEEVESRRSALPVGNNGVPCLSRTELERQDAEFERRVERLSRIPRHLVTQALAKNMVLAIQMGRHTRAQAVSSLLDILVSLGAALSLQEFERSYL
jgi:hypothetical protein